MSDIVALIDAREDAPKRPTTYRKRADATAEFQTEAVPIADIVCFFAERPEQRQCIIVD